MKRRQPRADHRGRSAPQARQQDAAFRIFSDEEFRALLLISRDSTDSLARLRLSEPHAAPPSRSWKAESRLGSSACRASYAVNNTVIGAFYVGTAFLFLLLPASWRC